MLNDDGYESIPFLFATLRSSFPYLVDVHRPEFVARRPVVVNVSLVASDLLQDQTRWSS